MDDLHQSKYKQSKSYQEGVTFNSIANLHVKNIQYIK